MGAQRVPSHRLTGRLVGPFDVLQQVEGGEVVGLLDVAGARERILDGGWMAVVGGGRVSETGEGPGRVGQKDRLLACYRAHRDGVLVRILLGVVEGEAEVALRIEEVANTPPLGHFAHQ